MIDGRLGLVEGSRVLCELRHALTKDEDPLFKPFVGFDSETDHYPVGQVRARYHPDYLAELDKEIEVYIERSRDWMLAACRNVVDRLSQ